MNAGQTCVAPDYLLVHPRAKAPLIEALKKVIHEFYGDDLKSNKDYCRIINKKNYDRLIRLMDKAKILHGGLTEEESLFIEPTLVEVSPEHPLMQEEIFGPILPLLEIKDTDSAIDFVVSRPKPLALYVFGKNKNDIDRILNNTTSGGVAINDVIMHMAGPTLPFGGVGSSGMGHYHGEYNFKTFTHERAVYSRSTCLDLPVRYPPYTKGKLSFLRRFFG